MAVVFDTIFLITVCKRQEIGVQLLKSVKYFPRPLLCFRPSWRCCFKSQAPGMVLGAEPGAAAQESLWLSPCLRPPDLTERGSRQEGLPASNRRPRRGGRVGRTLQLVVKCYLLWLGEHGVVLQHSSKQPNLPFRKESFLQSGYTVD